MNELSSVFSSGLEQLLTFSMAAASVIIGLATAIRAIDYAKSFVGFSDPFSYVHSIDGVESGDFDGYSLRYNGVYFQDESELNDYLLNQNDPDLDRYLDDALSDDSASAYDDHEQSF